MMKWRIHHNRL